MGKTLTEADEVQLPATEAPEATETPEHRSYQAFAEKVQDALWAGAPVDWVLRHFHMTVEELRDIDPELVDEDWEEDDPSGSIGY